MTRDQTKQPVTPEVTTGLQPNHTPHTPTTHPVRATPLPSASALFSAHALASARAIQRGALSPMLFFSSLCRRNYPNLCEETVAIVVACKKQKIHRAQGVS